MNELIKQCCECKRFLHEGNWISPNTKLYQKLSEEYGTEVTHGYCPEDLHTLNTELFGENY